MSTDIEPRNDSLAAWYEWRSQGIGGSDIAAIIGQSSYASPWSLWASKVGLVAPSAETPRQRLGKRLEPIIAAEFHDEVPDLYIVGEQTWCEHPENQWARCTVDGFTAQARYGQTIMSLPRWWQGRATGGFEAKSDGRYGWPDGIPVAHQAQAQWCMYITGLDHWWFGVIHGGLRFETYELPRDQADIDLMVERAEEFWQLVVTGNPPEMDGSDATARAIAEVWGHEDPGTRKDLDEIADRIAQRTALKAQIKAAQAEVDVIENEIKAVMAENELGYVGGVPVLTYRTVTVNRKPQPASTTTYRRLAAATKKERENA